MFQKMEKTLRKTYQIMKKRLWTFSLVLPPVASGMRVGHVRRLLLDKERRCSKAVWKHSLLGANGVTHTTHEATELSVSVCESVHV